MESLPKATFVLVPGVYHTVLHNETLSNSLRAHGYPTEAISHPSIGPFATTAAPNSDASNLRQVLENLVDSQQKDVVLFCHSYGGVPGSQSVRGLERSARLKAGQKGGIIKVIYLSAILPREGESLVQTFAGSEIGPGEWMDMDPTTNTFVVNPKAAATLFHDLPDEQAEHWASKLQPMSAHFVATPATDVCWDVDVPKIYVFCKNDRVFPLDGQQRMLERVQGARRGDWETCEMDCGHSPFLSHVEKLTEILTKA
ncbi:Alpha/beta hydrolase fold-1 [Mycena vitilis]|nr:Alpha/beta hydrolase fold-1 [Mycena vitilis]